MRSRDCRHYSRRELIESIYELERSVRMEQAGSMAEVAAVIAGLFDAADETAAMYLSGVRNQAEGRRITEEKAS